MNLDRIKQRLDTIYGAEAAEKMLPRIEKLISNHKKESGNKKEQFSQEDSILITYGNTINLSGKKPLQALHAFSKTYLKGAINTIHILPFFPYTTDRGFSVLDYKEVDPELGTWEDISAIRKDFHLMFDLVLNHMSDKSRWFKEYQNGNPEYKDFFIEYDEGRLPSKEDLARVTRPRTESLLVKYNTSRGEKYLWRTFLDDQIDLNYRNPEVLLKMIDVLLFYVSHGADIVRLDAIAYLWKELGTSCISLKDAHEIVKLFRDVLDIAAPGTKIITETNVPHRENLSYFGSGRDEAQLVYNFALAPLTLFSFLTGDAAKLSEWASKIERVSDQATYFNFLDSHDGIGLRPTEGILSDEEKNMLVAHALKKNGRINYRTDAQGRKIPYEMNITWWSFLEGSDDKISVARYLASRAIALSLIGIPGIYIHGLLGTENDLEGLKKTGHNRDINRKDLELDKTEKELSSGNKTSKVFSGYLGMLRKRSREKAFHPNGEQKMLSLATSVFSVLRTSPDRKEQILCLVNVTDAMHEVSLPTAFLEKKTFDPVLGSAVEPKDGRLRLEPYQALWLKAKISP